MARTVASRRGYTGAQKDFARIPAPNVPRSVFNRSHSVKTAFNSAYLIPIFADEAVPGDTFKMRMASFVRMSTPIRPIMDNLYLDIFFFAIPIRLVWDNFARFMGEQRNPGDSISFLTPIFSSFTPLTNSLSDYLGIPARGVAYDYINSLWHRAYNLVYNEWFRDENLQNSVVVDLDDGPDAITDYVLLRRGKRHDYFTSCLPFVQKGTAPGIPIGSSAPVIPSPANSTPLFAPAGNVSDSRNLIGMGVAAPNVQYSGAAFASNQNLVWHTTGLIANLSAATAATVNDLRNAFQIQRLLERDARGGTRYTEIVRSHFGVISPDQRLQRPEYIGGGSTRVNVHPVAATNFAANPSASAAAELSGFATAMVDGVGFLKSFTEHTLILGLANVRADITYQQGINRMFTRRTRYDFYWPEFAHLGEQAVLNREIYANGDANDALTFGYQERYAEMRYKPSLVTGTMASAAALSLESWHLALNFGSLPVLNSTFIVDQPPMSRVLKVTTQPEFFGDFYFQYRCARPMPTFSVPGMIDHF